MSSDNLDVVKEYVKLDSEEEVSGYRKKEFALHDVNIEKNSPIKDLISRFKLTSLRENIGFTNKDPEGTIWINGIPVYFSDNEIKVNDTVELGAACGCRVIGLFDDFVSFCWF